MKNLLTNPQPSQSDYINAIVKLGSRVYEAATVTPLQKMGKLSERLHNNIWIKREDRQPVNSFKLRGAYAMISSLSDEQKQAESLDSTPMILISGINCLSKMATPAARPPPPTCTKT